MSRATDASERIEPIQCHENGEQRGLQELAHHGVRIGNEVYPDRLDDAPVVSVGVDVRPEAAVIEDGVPGDVPEDEDEHQRDTAEVHRTDEQALIHEHDTENDEKTGERERERSGIQKRSELEKHHESGGSEPRVEQMYGRDRDRQHCRDVS